MPVESVLETLDLLLRLLELPLCVGALLAVLGGKAGDGPRLPGPSPLDDVARVQALPAQQGSLGPGVGELVVLGQDGELVLLGEPAPLGPGRGSPSCTSPSWARAARDAVVMVTVLRAPVSPWWDGGLQQVSHVSLTDRGPSSSTGFPACRGRHRLVSESSSAR